LKTDQRNASFVKSRPASTGTGDFCEKFSIRQNAQITQTVTGTVSRKERKLLKKQSVQNRGYHESLPQKN